MKQLFVLEELILSQKTAMALNQIFLVVLAPKPLRSDPSQTKKTGLQFKSAKWVLSSHRGEMDLLRRY
tara:strand:+ start:440 stop:643 length:204 start_codon:yes stop_codon:yes gene_type:complete